VEGDCRVSLNALYAIALLLLSPWLLVRSLRTGRYRTHLRDKLLGPGKPLTDNARPVAWFHGVSVGEVHLLRQIVKAFRERHPDWHVVISSTTDTGLAEARKHFADLTVLPYPFDFSWACRRALRAVSPRLIVLAESELWPNFLRAANAANVPVLVINGRMSPRTFRRYSKVAGLARRLLFDRVAMFGMQSETYADNLRRLGVAAGRVRVTGSVKYDGVLPDRDNPKTADLRRLLGIADTDLVWVAGSTHDPEERIVLSVHGRLRARFPNLKLILVPRAPERFDEVARLVEAGGFRCVRRSGLSLHPPADAGGSPRLVVVAPTPGEPPASAGGRTLPRQPPPGTPANAVLLIDTLGELGAAWGLATIGFTGGSLNDKRGGQSMIEPAGLGVPVLFGPHTWNFRDAAAGLLEAGGAIQVRDEAELEAGVVRLLTDPALRVRMGDAGRAFVRAQQGATGRTLDMMDEVLGSTSG
jgi:3-deoxy-D-manno-octulosonic-acid transferase